MLYADCVRLWIITYVSNVFIYMYVSIYIWLCISYRDASFYQTISLSESGRLSAYAIPVVAPHWEPVSLWAKPISFWKKPATWPATWKCHEDQTDSWKMRILLLFSLIQDKSERLLWTITSTPPNIDVARNAMALTTERLNVIWMCWNKLRLSWNQARSTRTVCTCSLQWQPINV